LNLSTLPAVSIIFLSPVKKGWHLLQSSTLSCFLVEPIVKVLPQEQTTWESWKNLGCIFSFISLFFSVNADLLFNIGVMLEFNLPIDQGINGVVPSQPYIVAGMDPGAALPQDDRTGQYGLPIISLDAQPFADAIATVARTAAAFFMSHSNHLA
jgi:hypothetical protein